MGIKPWELNDIDADLSDAFLMILHKKRADAIKNKDIFSYLGIKGFM